MCNKIIISNEISNDLESWELSLDCRPKVNSDCIVVVLSGLGRLTENTAASNQTSVKSSPFPLVSQQTLASLSSSPGLSNADSSGTSS